MDNISHSRLPHPPAPWLPFRHKPLQLLLRNITDSPGANQHHTAPACSCHASCAASQTDCCCMLSRLLLLLLAVLGCSAAVSLQVLVAECRRQGGQHLPANTPAEPAIAVDAALGSLLSKAAADDCDIV
jgi:hypothetical protein